MGISRDSTHKRRHTGGKRISIRKKRKFEMGRQPAMTKLGAKRVHHVRTRGGNTKFRALRLDTGNFSWGSEAISRKTRILNVVYNSANNEFTRTNTIVKNTIVQIDGNPFRQWYEQHYGQTLGKKSTEETADAKKSSHVQRKHAQRMKGQNLDKHIADQFNNGRLYACISSRPGQSGEQL